MLTFVVVVVLELRPDVIIDVLFVIAVGVVPLVHQMEIIVEVVVAVAAVGNSVVVVVAAYF